MSVCPKCQSEVPDTAFGLYTCTNCKSVLAIDFDGNASVAEEQPSQEISFQPEPVESPHEDSAQTPAPAWEEGHFSEPAEGLEAVEDVKPEKSQITQSSPVSLVKPIPDFALGEPYELKKTEPLAATTDFEDIVAFGNSEVSQGASGTFLYDILITGIDSEDLRAAVRESLTDKRFGWNVDDIMKKLRGGSVKIEKVNAIKASIIVTRLKGYSLDISWTQNGIFEINP